MDEPTTHLDMSSIDALVSAMTQFEGTLVFISHDVHFIKTLANKVMHTAGGQLTPYLGDYEFYLHKTQADSARAALTSDGGEATKTQHKAGRPALQESKTTRLDLRKQKKLVQALEKEREFGRELETSTDRIAELTSKREFEADRLELS